MTKIPMVDDSLPEELTCTTCLLPIQYQTKKNGKFFMAMLQMWKTVSCF